MKIAKKAEKPEIRGNVDTPVIPYHVILANAGNQTALQMTTIQRMERDNFSSKAGDEHRCDNRFLLRTNSEQDNMPEDEAAYYEWQIFVISMIFTLVDYIQSKTPEELTIWETRFRVLTEVLDDKAGRLDPYDNLQIIKDEAVGLRRYFYYYMIEMDSERRETNARIVFYHIRYILLLLYGVEGAKELALATFDRMMKPIRSIDHQYSVPQQNAILMIEEKVSSNFTFETWDDIDEAEKTLDDADGKQVYAFINQLEIQVNSMERKDFHESLKNVIPVYSEQDRCHTISNAYIKAGVFTPILDAAAALLRFMAWREERMPDEGYPVNLKIALYGIMFAVFPGGPDWESEQSNVTDLSKDYWKRANSLIKTIEQLYTELKSNVEGKTVKEFDMISMQIIINHGEELYDVLNNSPQNLRIGNSSTNRSIQEGLDIPLSDIEEITLNGVNYTDDLAKLTERAGGMVEAEVYRVITGSMSQKALLALLTLAELGDEEIYAFSGIQPETKRGTLQSSELFRVGEDNLDADTEDLVISLTEWPKNEENKLEEFLYTDKLIEYFRFTRVNGMFKQSKPQKKLTPPLGWDSLTEGEQRRRVIRRLETAVVREQLKANNYHLKENKSNRISGYNNCFFVAIYDQLVSQLAQHGISAPNVQTLAKNVRKIINNPYDFIQLDDGAGEGALNALVLALHRNLNVHLIVTEPLGYDYNTGVITFHDNSFDSDAIPDAPTILLHIYFNGYNHFMDVEIPECELGQGTVCRQQH